MFLHYVKIVDSNICEYSRPRISRIRVDRQIYPTYATIRLMRSEIKGFGTIVPKILLEMCEDPTYANPTYARFSVIGYLSVISGLVTFIWCVSWCFLVFDSPDEHPRITREERLYINRSFGEKQHRVLIF